MHAHGRSWAAGGGTLKTMTSTRCTIAVSQTSCAYEFLLAKIDIDTAENGPSKALGTLRKKKKVSVSNAGPS